MSLFKHFYSQNANYATSKSLFEIAMSSAVESEFTPLLQCISSVNFRKTQKKHATHYTQSKCLKHHWTLAALYN